MKLNSYVHIGILPALLLLVGCPGPSAEQPAVATGEGVSAAPREEMPPLAPPGPTLGPALTATPPLPLPRPPDPARALEENPPPACSPVTAPVAAGLKPLLARLQSEARPEALPSLGDRLAVAARGGAAALQQALPTITTPGGRALLAEASGSAGDPCLVPLLIQLVRAEDGLPAAPAARVLAQGDHPAGWHAAALYAARSQQPDARRLAGLLGEQAAQEGDRAREIVPLLVWLALPPRAAILREAATASLARVGGPEIRARLREILEGDDDPLVRLRAAEGLATSPLPEEIPVFSRALNDVHPTVAAAAAAALGRTGRPAAARPALTGYLGSGRREAIEPVLRALAVLGDREALPAIRPLLDDRDGYLQVAAIDALVQLGGDPAALAPIRALLQSPKPSVRRRAALALGELGQREVRPLLEELGRRDPDPRVQEAARESLTRLAGEGSSP